MKKLILTSLVLIALSASSVNAQENSTVKEKPAAEKYGKTLNFGMGIGYYGYVGQPVPVGTINYEFDVAKNLTLAPFVGIYSYQRYYYWGNPDKPFGDPSYRRYSYRETAVPVGVKGTYYFDQLFHANAKWDFYAAGSIGFVFRSRTWESGYYGDQYVYKTASPLYLDAHIGAEYHITQKTGIFLDLSTGVSTFGFAIHF
ncbi:MAG TPA: hypothetical protein VN026_17825 [Bacteroidia bacterium]|jgi:hypothetical protein|nr:hypothetical protein [Bacteroidia bacterium]